MRLPINGTFLAPQNKKISVRIVRLFTNIYAYSLLFKSNIPKDLLERNYKSSRGSNHLAIVYHLSLIAETFKKIAA